MRQAISLLTFIHMVVSFTVLPYIQIDYAHYFHLAQCKAKCAEKYGIPSTRPLLDGSIEEFLNVANADNEACDTGCHQHRRSHTKAKGPSKTAINDGHRFWSESSAESAKVGSTIVSSVQLLCQNPSLDEEFGESFDGIVGISLLRPAGPTRFVVQWKQRTQTMGYYDESQWITASVEPSVLFKVKGLIPGVQYRFMVTAVGPAGRLGETVASPWTEISSNSDPRPPGAPLTTRNGYNSDRGVTVHVEWSRTPQDSCYYKLHLTNSSVQLTVDVTLDHTSSILLSHLDFDTDYSLAVAAVSADKIQTSKPLTQNFKSLPCRDVHGHGSLQCAPDPVSDLAIVMRPNGTALISWEPSSDPENILFYQVVYHALENDYDCHTQQETINVVATATSTELILPGHECEYVVRVVNYDLIGRDASAETRVIVDPALPFHFDVVFRPEFLLIAASVLLLPCVCLLCRCQCRRKCPHRIAEKQQKLTEYA